MDDINDSGYSKVQLATMDYFISKNLPFTASIIVSQLANSSHLDVFHKIQEGLDRKLFEIAIHGYRHVNYALWTKEEQESELGKANDKLEYLFGKRANIFMPPYNEFNPHTIEAMSDLNISVLSTGPDKEQEVFNPYNNKILLVTNNSKIEVSRVSDQKPLVYHVPFAVSLLGLHLNGTSQDAVVPIALKLIDESIAKYGFAQVRLHPSDFPQGDDPDNGKTINKLNQTKFQELTKIVDNLLERDIRIASIKDILPSPSAGPSL